MSAASWYVYMVRCADGTFYTGIATDLARRLAEHNDGPRGARYTRSRRPVSLAYAEEVASRSEAAAREYRVRRLGVAQKRRLIQQQWERAGEWLTTLGVNREVEV